MAAIVLIFRLGMLATTPVVGEEERTKLVSLVLESQVLRLLLIQLS